MILEISITIIVIVFLFWRIIFLRDPERNIPYGKVIVSPADGKIIEIIKVGGIVKRRKGMGMVETLTSEIGKNCYLVSIFMSPLNVHVNRSPISGKILSVKHSKGKFLSANSLKALENEKNEIVIEGEIKVKIVQIAGLLARRIECWVKEGDQVVTGSRVGRINLGSQVVIIMPTTIDLKVRKGQKVKAGSTVIATY